MNGQILNGVTCRSSKSRAKRGLIYSITGLSLIISAGSSAQTISVHSRTTRVIFNIPKQNLETSLLSFAQQAGIQLVMTSSDVRGLQSPAIVGAIAPSEALKRILGSSPLSAAWISDRTVAIRTHAAHIQPVALQTAAGVRSSSVSANDTKPINASGGLQEIVVTAQKRATNLQKTPISISVMTASDLANRHAQSLADLGDGSIPSLRVAPFSSRNSALILNIRGIGALEDTNQPGREQGSGVYLDGVYLGRAQGLGAALYDVERIEVLKGPQGTLFGRNTEGGAVSIVTRKPSGEFHMDLTGGLGNYNSREAIAHVDLPAFHDVSIKVDALYQRQDGTVKNTLQGQSDFNGYNRSGAHVAALWRAAPNFEATYEFDISRDATTPFFGQLLSKGSLPLAPIIRVQPDRVSTASLGLVLQPSIGHTDGHLLNLNWHVSQHLDIKSISSYRELTQTQYDSGAVFLAVYAPNARFGRYSLANLYQHQYSQEIQLIGDLPHITFVAGGYYFHEHIRDDAWTPNTLQFNADGTGYTVLPSPGIAATPFPDRASIVKTSSEAAFGQATWTPTLFDERLHLTGGLRFSHDRKTGELYLVNGVTPTVNGVTAPVSLNVRSKRVDPLINLAIDLSSGVHAYGKWSTGYKAAGANSRSLTFRSFGPESVSEFEVGAKTEFLDKRVRLNVAAYTGQYKNVQIDFNAIIPGANRTTIETTNADGNGRIKGIEADLTLAPAPGLTLNASYAYNSVRLPLAPNPFVTGNPLVTVFPTYSPKQAASAAVDYSLPFRESSLSLHLDVNYSDRQYVTASSALRSDKVFLVNGRLTLADIKLNNSGTKIAISVWGRNILDRQEIFYKLFNPAIGTIGYYNQPRTFGFEGRIRI